MSKSAERYEVSSEALAILRREGTGWNHDMERGCLHMAPGPRRPGPLSRIMRHLNKGI